MDRKVSLFGPLLLIAAGAIWILIQTQVLTTSHLWALVYIWPFLLIAAGIGLILRSLWKYASTVMSVLVVGGATLAVFIAPQLGWNRAPVYLGTGDLFFVSGDRGSGKIITDTRPVQGFSSIRLAYPAQVTLRPGEVESLTIQAEDNVAPTIRTEVVNGVLEIDNLHHPMWDVTPTQPVKITITFKNLSELDFATAGEVWLDGLQTDRFQVNMSGAGTLHLDGLQLKSMECHLSGAGSIHASGQADDLNLSMSGLGSFDGADLHSQTADASVSGAGSASLWVDSDLSARISGMGSVNYFGDPQVTQSISGLGSVNSQGSK